MLDAASDDEDGRSRSPGLQAVKVKYRPSPSPPPFLPQKVVSPPSASRRRSSNKRKPKPSQGDVVLLNYMGSHNHPDIAGTAGKEALKFDSGESGAESGDSDEEMEDLDAEAAAKIQADEAEKAKQMEQAEVEAEAELAQKKELSLNMISPEDTASEASPINPLVSEKSPESVKSPGTDISASEKVRDLGIKDIPEQVSSSVSPPHKTPIDRKTLSPWPPPENSLATSPVSEHLLRPDSPERTLPALQNPNSPPDGPGSPQSATKLPSISNLIETADKTNVQLQRQRQLSFSSVSGPSPSYTSGSAGSPPGLGPLSHTSPILHSVLSPSLATSGHPSTPFANIYTLPRRTSNASEATSPRGYPPTLHSASTTESYSHSSTDGYSPSNASKPSPNDPPAGTPLNRINIDGAAGPPILPPPAPLVQKISTVPAHGSGGFKCDYPGCNAAPFQTQYLLNSHANVHSTSRPHYCPVPGCPRSEGGKGFKRKNEMIRHGLVHDSPGYVCPFCPDREHKYPRPDNLQRHVRVHHAERDRDDPRLREVLSQRPEGGNRGRRRRMV